MFQMDIEFDSQNEFFGFQNSDNLYPGIYEWNPQSTDLYLDAKSQFQAPMNYISPVHLPLYNLKPTLATQYDKVLTPTTTQLSAEGSFSTDCSPSISLNKGDTLSMQEPDSPLTKTYSKDSLKFSRRITKLMTKHLASSLSTQSSLKAASPKPFIKTFLTTSSRVINSILAAYGTASIQQIEIDSLIKIQLVVLQYVWEQFRSCLSYNKNKKICIVKPEFWNILFCRKTFAAHAKKACFNLEKSIFQRMLIEYEGILNSFCDILFSINQLILLALILKDDSAKGGQFIRMIDTIDNLIVSMMDPRLFEFYNHRSGKFASECCGKCKICRSKSIPEDFGGILENTRKKCNVLIDTVISICPKGLDGGIEEDQLMYLLCLLVQP